MSECAWIRMHSEDYRWESKEELEEMFKDFKDNTNIPDDELWDHYSGLPNPAWYQYKKELNNEEDDTDNITDLGTNNEKI